MRRRAEARSANPARMWHVPLLAMLGAITLLSTQYYYGQQLGEPPTLADMWWAMLALPLICASIVTLAAGGATLGKRIVGSASCGVLTGLLFSAGSFWIAGWTATAAEMVVGTVWVVFILTVLSPIGALATELALPEP